MHTATRALRAALLALGVLACASTYEPELAPGELVRGLQSGAPEERVLAAQEAWKAGPPAVGALAPLLDAEDPATAKHALLALEALAHHAAAPGRERERRELSAELVELLDERLSPASRDAVLRLLGATAADRASVRAVARRLRAPATADAALFALQRSTHPAAEEALIAALDSDDLAVPRAAVARVLGARRSQAAVEALLELARTGQPDEVRVARTALARGGDPRARAALVAAFERGADGAAADLLRYADVRLSAGDPEAARALFERLERAPTDHQRAAAVRGLARAGGSGTLARLVEHLDDDAPDVRAMAREGLTDAAAADASPRLIGAFEAAGGARRRGELLRVLVARADPAAGRLVRESIEDGDADVRLTALELAGALESPGLEGALLRYAETGAPAERSAARASLLGYARLHRLRGEHERALELYHALLDETERRALLVEALAGVAAVAQPASLERLRALQQRPELADDVGKARIAIAVAMADERREEALAELEAVAVGGASRGVRAQAARRMEALGVDTTQLARRRGFVERWYLSGPYPGGSEGDFASHPFGPDGPRVPFGGAAEVPVEGDPERSWRLFTSTDIDGAVDLLPQFEEHDNVCAYAAAQVRSGGDVELVLKLGSDDGIAAWVNGELVHQNWAWRGLAADQDEVPIRLREGENVLLLKISQGGGDWAFCARLCHADGQPVELPPR